MRKTASEIEADVYALIKASKLVITSTGNTPISGLVYKEGMRPLNALTEDISVSFLTGLDGQVQDFIVNVNIFVKDIDNGSGVFVKNITRIKALEKLAQVVLDAWSSTEYTLKDSDVIQAYKAENQHFINVRLKLKRTSI
jgi:hypothetical protein